MFKFTLRSKRLKKRGLFALASALVIIVMIANVEVIAQPYTPSPVLDPNIEFDFAQFTSDGETPQEYKIHFASAGNDNAPGVLFVHGTPGGWGAFERYLENRQLQKDFFMVSVDRMGWGRSQLDPKIIDGDFDLQASSIKAILDRYPEKKWTIVGHSLGASIGPKVALIAPQSVDSLLLLAGSLNPKLGNPRWYNWAASTWAVSRLIGETMRYSNREIMGLKKSLRKMDTELKQVKLDVQLAVMQGQKDRLVSPKNPAYVAKEWQHSFTAIDLIELPEEGHFLPWRQTPLVIATIYRLRKAIEQ